MFNLTRQERQVILFLVSMALLGTGISFLAKRYSLVRAVAAVNPDIGRINLNLADKETLITIPGVGEKLAQRIIAYRQKQGSFNNLEELKDIKGISDYKYEKIKEYLIVK